ncbi:glycosyltransferase [Pseudomonas cremoricolorata]|uniref:glycosyltransferase n=1 Tax=Pseudomonas cremoricolorata TaxID=157783 RepID=UPI0003FA6299|nr:glycosyltransferase [Pseudomonas cremoricolorata]
MTLWTNAAADHSGDPTVASQSLPRVLVLLAAFNGRQWFDEQIASILAQTGVAVHVLVSVDASDDDTESLVTQWAEQEPRVTHLAHGQRFGGAAANFFRLLAECDPDGFDYIAFSDQDDQWLPGKLQRAHQVLAAGVYSAYSADVLAYWPDGREQTVRKSQPLVAYDYLFEAAGPGCTYVFNKTLARKLIDTVGRQCASIKQVTLHDWYCYAIARASGHRWFIDQQIHMRYRQHASNQVGVNTGLQAFQRRIGKVFAGWWLGQARLIADLAGRGDDAFVRSWRSFNRVGLLRLALSCNQCRRRPRDKAAFALLCIGLAVKGVKS